MLARMLAPTVVGCGHGLPLRTVPLLPGTRQLHARQQHRNIIAFGKGRKGLAELLNLQSGREENRPRIKAATVSPEREVPAHIPRPPYAATYSNPGWNGNIMVHDEQTLPKMRAACKLAAQVLQMAGKMAQPGVTTEEIDIAVHKMITEAGAYPSPLRYGKFPKSVCTSVNEVVCHGIPDARPLQDGDIINIDVTVYLDGHHGDTSCMFCVGEVDKESRDLIEATKQCLHKGIAVCAPGVPVNEIGAACEKYVRQTNFTIIEDFCGHGVGEIFHASPCVVHKRNNVLDKMVPWQTFTIEPILCTGSPKSRGWPDKWTVVTKDGGRTAQFEHTILITPDGHEILTLP